MTGEFPKVRLRIVLAPGIALGPGKADLLQGIAETGSIRAAGRRLSMSYKRAWNLVGELNRGFDEPLIETGKGGAGGGGGARLTGLGEEILARLRAIETTIVSTAEADLDALSARVKKDVEPGADSG
ncbi:LysR family transcriptional regulator [Rhizobiales bacterium]|uniref:winged helix-turn-helix domain-containing protein n=1 Tax=Hongsoonwoonella zoysiae TaxID=2821844 RepID=UPI0015610362|nr:LysR family transcriptional regulator [Hongsoonwoonella zoysiae]NRG17221.1 LysR family transcriptional regulator [Hongsoonwoonella zoysiae]